MAALVAAGAGVAPGAQSGAGAARREGEDFVFFRVLPLFFLTFRTVHSSILSSGNQSQGIALGGGEWGPDPSWRRAEGGGEQQGGVRRL